MAQYWEDWAGQAVGSTAPTGWTKRWVTSGVTTTIVTDAAAPAGKSLRITKSTNGRFGITMNAVDSDADRATVNVAMLIRAPVNPGDSVAYTNAGPLVRGAGAAGTETSYHCVLREETTQFRACLPNKYVSGAGSGLIGPESYPAQSVWDFGAVYWIYFSVSGPTVRAKIATAAAPTTIVYDTGDITDTAVSAAGWVGIFAFTSAAHDILAVGIGTGGDTAPTEPLTTTHELTASDLVVSSPVLGAPALNAASSVDNLTAANLVVSAPVLGTPALSGPALEYVFTGDSFNINPTGSSIANADTDTPTVTIAPRKQRIIDTDGDNTLWRTFYGKLIHADGRRPLFKVSPTDYFLDPITTSWRPWYSYDNVTWQRFPAPTLSGSYWEFQLATAFTGDDVWIGFQPGYPMSRVAALITELATNHADKLHQLPSANSSHIIEMLPSQTDELGNTVPSQPFYGYGIWDAAFTATTPSRTVVLTCGIHPGEHVADWVFEGFMRFLVSDDAKAVLLRQNYQFLIYPNTNPVGRYGGHIRGQWDSVAPYKNANRDFGTDADAFQLQNSQALRDALDVDLVGRELACSLDFHGQQWNPSGKPASIWFVPDTADAGLRDAFEDRMQVYNATYIDYTSSAGPSATTQYMQREHGSRHAYTPEAYEQHPATSGVDSWRLAGQHFAKAIADSLADMQADGAYPLYKTDELTASNLTASSPVLGTPSLAEVLEGVDALTANDLVTDSPVLGSPALSQIHALVALGLTVGGPVLGTPALTSGVVAPITAAEVARTVRATARMRTVRYEIARA